MVNQEVTYFDIIGSTRQGMLAIEPAGYEPIRVDFSDCPICVLLSRSCKDHNFEVPAHLFEERRDAWPDIALADITHVFVVNQGFV